MQKIAPIPLQSTTAPYQCTLLLNSNYILFKYRKRETKNLSTDADSSTVTNKILLVRQNLRRFYTFYKQKFLNLRPLLSITFPQGFQKSKKFLHWTLGSGGKKTLKRSEHMMRIGPPIFLFLLASKKGLIAIL